MNLLLLHYSTWNCDPVYHTRHPIQNVTFYQSPLLFLLVLVDWFSKQRVFPSKRSLLYQKRISYECINPQHVHKFNLSEINRKYSH